MDYYVRIQALLLELVTLRSAEILQWRGALERKTNERTSIVRPSRSSHKFGPITGGRLGFALSTVRDVRTSGLPNLHRSGYGKNGSPDRSHTIHLARGVVCDRISG